MECFILENFLKFIIDEHSYENKIDIKINRYSILSVVNKILQLKFYSQTLKI